MARVSPHKKKTLSAYTTSKSLSPSNRSRPPLPTSTTSKLKMSQTHLILLLEWNWGGCMHLPWPMFKHGAFKLLINFSGTLVLNKTSFLCDGSKMVLIPIKRTIVSLRYVWRCSRIWWRVKIQLMHPCPRRKIAYFLWVSLPLILDNLLSMTKANSLETTESRFTPW